MKLFLSFILIFLVGIEKECITSNPTYELVPGLLVFTDYEKGIEFGKNNQKPILIYFNDKASANCRKFETNILSDDKVKNYLNKYYVVVSLLVVDKTPLSANKVSPKTGRSLKTVGEYNYDIEKSLYNKDIQPYCAVLDKYINFINGKDYTRDPEEFLEFLKASKGK